MLSGLLLWGLLALDFEVSPAQAVFGLLGTLLTQLCFSESQGQRFDPRSPLISGLSLALLLRVDSPLLAALAGFLAIGSKFAIRVNGRHVFNPTNFGLVVTMLLTNEAWVSPGQWGSQVYFGFLMVCIGGVVVNRAARSDVTYAFLVFYVGLLLGRPFNADQRAG